MNRLVSAVQDGQEEKYAYDLVGNRLKKESAQGTEIYYYNAKNQLTHRQSGPDTLRYLYDRQGNMLEEQGQGNRKQYRYDAANRQVGIIATKADGITEKLRQTNRYDGEGLRYETEENGKVIRFLFDRGELAQESREGEKISYARGRQPVSLSRSGKERNYFVQDEMGSTLFLLDHNHEIQKAYRYDAFGNILKETGELSNRLTYTGQMYDGAAGQYYLRARFYNPAIGRFLQEDTYRGDGLNLYAYCANNPVMYYDPSGHGLCPNGKTAPGTSPDEIRAMDADIIDQMDANGGHIQQRHVGKDNDFLLRRAAQEHVAATSFTNKKTATDAIQQNIRQNADIISNWLNDPDADTRLITEGAHSHPIGKGVNVNCYGTAAKSVTYNLTSSRAVLVKDVNMPNGYRIITAFPIFN